MRVCSSMLALACPMLLMVLAPVPAPAQDRLDRYVREQMEAHEIPGLALAVVRNGDVIAKKAYGLASVELGVPVTPDSVFQIYSVTKIFAGIAVLRLVEDGVLSLETPVTDVMPALPRDWGAIRIRHLLAHTSGLPELNDNPAHTMLSEDERGALSSARTIAFAAGAARRSAPGEKWAYHRFGYTLLGAIVEERTRRTFADFLQDRLLAPLGMRATRFGDSSAVVQNRATAYNRAAGVLRTWTYPFGFGNPGAGLNSSVADLAVLMAALDRGEVLSRASLEAMWSPTALGDGTTHPYGLGWTIAEHHGRKVVGHEGGGAAWIAHFPADRLSVVVLCNLNGARADGIPYGIADLFLTPRSR